MNLLKIWMLNLLLVPRWQAFWGFSSSQPCTPLWEEPLAITSQKWQESPICQPTQTTLSKTEKSCVQVRVHVAPFRPFPETNTFCCCNSVNSPHRGLNKDLILSYFEYIQVSVNDLVFRGQTQTFMLYFSITFWDIYADKWVYISNSSHEIWLFH